MEKHQIALELYRHCDDLERYAYGLAEKAAEKLEETEDEIELLIYRLADEKLKNDFQSKQKLARLFESISSIRIEPVKNILKLFEEENEELIFVESAFLAAALSILFGEKGKDITSVEIDRISKYGRYRGLSRKEIFDHLGSTDIHRIYQKISNGLDNNTPIDKILEEVKKEFNTTRRFVKNETDVIVNGIVNDVALAFAEKNKLVLYYSSMMDDKVCPQCERDGEFWNYNDPDIPNLPLHVNCRCRLIPVPPESDFEASDLDVTFAEYISSIQPGEQKKRLGDFKYRAFRKGSEKLKSFVEPPASSFLTLQQISERDSDFILMS